jgi:hypothetical protein
MKTKYLKIRLIIGIVSLVVGLIAATFALFAWGAPDGFLFFLGEYSRYVCAFGGFASIIFGSMLINDFFTMKKNDLRSQAFWYQETTFEEGKMFLGHFFLNSEEEKEFVKQKI